MRNIWGLRLDLLSEILTQLKLSGTLYFRTSFTSPWSIRVPAYENVARFHFVHRGRCLVRISKNKPPVMLEQGDLIIIPRGAAHTLFCDLKNEDSVVQLEQVLAESGFTGTGTLVYGEFGTDHETQLVCGHFAFDPHASHPLIDALPDHIHTVNYGKQASNWMDSTLNIIGDEAGKGQLGSDLIALKLSEILFAQALRGYIETEGRDNPMLAGFADAKMAKALHAIHAQPAHNWTVEELARVSSMSRTSFATKFAHYMSTSPLNYLTKWRMQLARQELVETESPMIVIAENAGYQSEAAFGRVFKKTFAVAPATYRRQARQQQVI